MEIDQITATIQSGQSLSGQVDIGNKSLVGIIIPAAWTTANLSFQASPDGGTTWGELLDQSAAPVGVASVAGGAQVAIAIDPTKLRGFSSFKIRSGTSSTPVNQASTVALTLITRLAI